jgi:Lhr-like helicase
VFVDSDSLVRQRVDQLTSLTRISRELSTTLEPEQLLKRVYDEVLLATNADCGRILLFDLEKTKEILEKIQNKEIKINSFEGLSPLAELGFRYELQDVAKPERPEKEIFKIFKNRLLNSKVLKEQFAG